MTQPRFDHDNPCDPVEQQKRQDLLEERYQLSGRANKTHPAHCTFTGLWEEKLNPEEAQ